MNKISWILATICSVLVFVTITIVTIRVPNYSLLNGYISFLGSSASRYRTIINIGFAVAGICTIILSYILSKSLPPSDNARIANVFFIISGVLLILLGIFPTDPSGEGTTSGILHRMIGNLFYVMMPIGIIFFGAAFRKAKGWSKMLANFSFILAGFTLAAAVIVKFFSFYRGLVERLGIGSDLLWMALISYILYQKYSREWYNKNI